MSIEISMPKLSDTMEEGTLLQWRIKQGDRVKRGDIIAEVETDKAAMEMEAYEDGTVTELRVAEGETVPVGTVLAILDTGAGSTATAAQPKSEASVAPPKEEAAPEAAATKDDRRDQEKRAAQPVKPKSEKQVAEEPPKPAPRLAPAEEGRPERRAAISPAARRLAEEHGLELTGLRGTGPGGRVVLTDVEKQLGRQPAESPRPPAAQKTGGASARTSDKAVKVRRIMARKMAESWQTIPHFYVTFSVDMTDIIRFRKDLGLTINDFILAAVSRSLQEHPWVNSWWIDGEAAEQPDINIAMAIATDRGLYNPVIHSCSQLTLRELSSKSADLGQRAHAGKLTPEDLEGGTFTVSNMGMLGVESFRAIITPPQAAVLAVGTVRGEVIVDDQGEPAVAPVMRMTLAADHRILDGADAAEFMATLKSYLEAPVTLISRE